MDSCTENWLDVEEHLIACEKAYREIGNAGEFARVYVIAPLRDRFDNQERTRELAEEIMTIEI
jgi:hypothetical protein